MFELTPVQMIAAAVVGLGLLRWLWLVAEPVARSSAAKLQAMAAHTKTETAAEPVSPASLKEALETLDPDRESVLMFRRALDSIRLVRELGLDSIAEEIATDAIPRIAEAAMAKGGRPPTTEPQPSGGSAA